MLFFASLYCKKKLCTNFSLLTKAYQFSVVQSTTTNTTTCAPYHCLHTVTYSLPVVPIRKLLQYSYGQGHGDTHCYIVGSHTQNNRTVPFCISMCTLCMTPICVVHLLNCTTLSCTMYSLHNVPRFSTLPHHTSRPSCHECCTSMRDYHTMQLLTLHILCQWQSNVSP